VSDDVKTSLTRKQFDSVIRRATELAAAADAGEGRLSEVELFRIASEVGINEEDVRTALTEVRSSGNGGTTLDRIFGCKTVSASRIVFGARVNLKARLDEFLVASQLLRSVRRTPDVLVYHPAVDWMSRLARAASLTFQKHYIASAKSVEVRLAELDDERVLVEFLVDHGNRSTWIAQAVLGGGVAGGVVGAVVTAFAAWSPAPLALAVIGGFVAWICVWMAVGTGIAERRRKIFVQVQAEVDGVLDCLEAGEALEPPPASWRRWVKRHFHGVARDLSRTKKDLE